MSSLSALASSTEFVVAFTAVGVGAVLYNKLKRNSRLPPGPVPLPFIGNWLDVPQHEQWLTYQKWSQKFGSDVLSVKVFSTDMIIINSAEAAHTLLERNAALYSDRPSMAMTGDLVGLSWHFGFMPYDDDWRTHRKVFAGEFTPSAVLRYQNPVRKWTHTLLQNILSHPENLFDHLQHMASGIVLETTYGLQVQPSGQPDPFIGAAKQAIEGMGATGIFGTYLVDYLPILKYLPFAKFKEQARKWRVSVDVAATVPFDIIKKAMADGTAQPSVTTALLDNDGPLDETAIRQAGAAMFASGSAATVSALGSFFLAMVQHPEIQASAQAELDKVLDGRLPDFSDEASLPYISALLKEVYRWNPVVPLAFPHKLTADDTYKDYSLPAGSVVVFNSWAMLHDPEIYPDPLTFKPERFLTLDGRLNPKTRDPDQAFGFARRSCPGRRMAHSSMFISVASILSVFKITKSTDSSGRAIEPSGEYTPGLLSYPIPFECTIRPRSENARELVTATTAL